MSMKVTILLIIIINEVKDIDGEGKAVEKRETDKIEDRKRSNEE